MRKFQINRFSICRVATLGILLIGILLLLSYTSQWRQSVSWRKKLDPLRALLLLSGNRRERKYKQNHQDGNSNHFSSRPCNVSMKNIVLIKIHKTGSTTLAHIVDRFGFSRKLSFLLPKDARYGRSFIWDLGSSVQGSRDFRLPSRQSGSLDKKSSYNLFTLHTTYNRQSLDKLMAPGANYITSIRDPVEQFESAFVFYRFYLALPERFQDDGIKMETKIEEWLRLPQYYKDKYEAIVKRGDGVKTPNAELYCRNSQMRDLGLDVTYQENNETVSKYVSLLDQRFDFVLITEYFDESLLILRKELCWNIDDILYIPENQRPEIMKTATLTEHLRQSIRTWNSADQLLYEHFNGTLWKKIAEYGEGFHTDLEEFRDNLQKVSRNCLQEKQDKLLFSRVKYIKKKK